MQSHGRVLRQIRHARGKSLETIAGLAGISASHLSRLESGERALDRRSRIVALANALEVSPARSPAQRCQHRGTAPTTARSMRYGWRCWQ